MESGRRLFCRINTNLEDTSCVCCLSDGRLLSGHESTFKLWSSVRVSNPLLLRAVDVHAVGGITNICQSPKDQHQVAVAVSSSVMCYDLRNLSAPFQMYSYNREEINEVCFHTTQPYICACDDSGEIKIIDIETSRLFRTLTGYHSNLCTCAKFVNQTLPVVLSGGMDCKVIMWDFINARPITEVSAQSISTKVQSGKTFINPPMVHCLDTWTSIQCVACGLGNGMVAVYEIGDKEMTLQCSLVPHSSMVVCVCCIERLENGAKRYYIVSGGNDCRLVVMQMVEEKQHQGAAYPAAVMQLKVVEEVQHASKINWISVDIIGSVTVADQTSFLSIYKIF